MMLYYCGITFSDGIQLATLVVVAVYTTLTFLLWLQQHHQFFLAQRPWITVGDVYYDKDIRQPRIAFHLYNIGKLPADCQIQITRVGIKLPEAKELISVARIDPPQPLAVFPHTTGTDSRYIFFFGYGGVDLLTDGTRLEFDIVISYSHLGSKRRQYKYSFSATLEVPSFRKSESVQTTMIRDTKTN